MTFGERMRNADQAPSLAAKLGFQDPDRKNPQHDEIVLWLDGLLRRPELRAQIWSDAYNPDSFQITWEQPVGDARWLAGFVDLHLQIDHLYSAFFEVKTQLPSLGDLIRQLRFYEAKTRIRESYLKLYVVSSDSRYVHVLRDQGIGFVEYPSGEITHPVNR